MFQNKIRDNLALHGLLQLVVRWSNKKVCNNKGKDDG